MLSCHVIMSCYLSYFILSYLMYYFTLLQSYIFCSHQLRPEKWWQLIIQWPCPSSTQCTPGNFLGIVTSNPMSYTVSLFLPITDNDKFIQQWTLSFIDFSSGLFRRWISDYYNAMKGWKICCLFRLIEIVAVFIFILNSDFFVLFCFLL